MSASRIRLCMAVNNLDVGGLERLVISLLNHLPRDRYDLSLVCLSGEGKLFSQVDLPRSDCLILDKEPNLGSAAARVRLPILMYRIGRFLQEKRVDILDVHNLAPLLFAGAPARMLPNGPRVIYTEHNQIHRSNESARRKFREYARIAHKIVTVSRDLRRTLVEKVDVPTPIQVIHNGIDGSRFGRPSDGAVRRELGIDANAFVVGTAVVLSEQKGVKYLLEATKLVHAQAPEIQFVIAGDGPQRAELEDKARADKLGSNVRFIGYRSDIPALIASYDTYVLPSLWEGLPLALLEALAQGLPIVATTVGGNPEVVESGENGFLVPPKEPRALAEQILRVYRDADLRSRVKEANQKKFAAQFSLDAMIRSYGELFGEQMSAKTSRARSRLSPAVSSVAPLG